MVEIVIADAGALIALSRVVSLSLLADGFGQVRVTQTVLAECLARGDRPEGHDIRHAVDVGWLAVQADVPYSRDWNLGAGEASAIAAALALQAGVLIDDRAGRRFAMRLGLPVIGVLGILVKAKRLGKIERLRPLTEQLVNSGYYLTTRVVDEALRMVGED